jgi:hypothetical protein
MNLKRTMKTAMIVAAAVLWATPPALRADDDGPGGSTTPGSAPKVDHGGDRDGVAIHLPTQFGSDADLKKLISDAKDAQKGYVARQNALQSKLKGATSTERQRLVNDLKDNQDKFLDDTRRLREEIRNRISALKSELKNSKPIDAGSGGGGGTHPHRGH